MRTARVLTLLAVLAASLTAGIVTGAAPASATEVTWCDAAEPSDVCITAFEVDGEPKSSGDPEWRVQVQRFTVGLEWQILATVLRNGTEELLDRDTTLMVTLETDQVVPRVVTGKGRDVTVTRIDNGDGTHGVTVSGRPVQVAGQCNQEAWPWTCPEYSGEPGGTDPEQWQAYFDFHVTEYRSWEDPDERDALSGLDFFHNIAATSVPPEVGYDGAGPFLRVDLANRSFLADGTTRVLGRLDMRIPNTLLRDIYGIPDPSTLTRVGLDATLSGPGSGTLTVAPDPDGTAMRVTGRGITFSTRTLQVRTGTVTPTRPGKVRATRVKPRKARVQFAASTPRGAEVSGYAVRCRNAKAGSVLRAGGTGSPVVVTKLRRGTAYQCSVRARSEVGPGPWSKAVRLAPRP
jgi:hypothetical protein